MDKETILGWTAVLLVAVVVILVAAISLGATDPRPVGERVWAAAPGALTLAPGQEEMRWLDAPLPSPPFAVRATAVNLDTWDVGYGIVLGDQGFTVQILPIGYAAVGQGDASLFSMQPWPHVDPERNEIWVDVADGRATVRVNRELLWSGTAAVAGGRLGLTAINYSDRETAVSFEQVELFASTAD